MRFSEDSIIKKLSAPNYKPKNFDQMCELFFIPKSKRKLFRRFLKNMTRSYQLIRTSHKTYRVTNEKDFITGRVQKNPKGFGFLIPDDRSQEDVFLSRREVLEVMDKDRVKVLLTDRGNGKLIEILQRKLTKVVGKVIFASKAAFVAPLGSDMTRFGTSFVEIENNKKLKDIKKNIVVCKITKYPSNGNLAQGEITEVLGKTGDVKVDFDVMIHKFDLRHEFSEEVLVDADKLLKWSLDDEIKNRKDLREMPFVTIDGETAKDFDDAVCVEKLSNGCYKLWVSIADVSYFVKRGTALDDEAYERATSVYFPGGVVPMLPEVLSNNLCSLRPNETKMTFTCEMDFDAKGNRTSYDIYESVIESKHRMTYTEVQGILTGKKEVREKYKNIISNIEIMDELKELLKQQKHARGCLNFDLPEPELILNIQGNIETVIKRERLPSHMLIEEFMIAANEATAEFMYDRKLPFIYRVHQSPDDVTLLSFHELLHNMGYKLKYVKDAHPKLYSDVLERIKGKPEENIINIALLRSMKQARYVEKNLKHFGLASECYTHFTSPIRRYPDLIVHRLLKEQLKKKGKNSDKMANVKKDEKLRLLAEAAAHCSMQERHVEEAEREFVSLKKAQFMMDKVGHQFVGFISGVKEFGFFVELEPFFIEGLVRLSTLEDDRYQFVAEHYYIRGQKRGAEFHLGQKVTVDVKHVDVDKRQIDFKLVE